MGPLWGTEEEIRTPLEPQKGSGTPHNHGRGQQSPGLASGKGGGCLPGHSEEIRESLLGPREGTSGSERVGSREGRWGDAPGSGGGPGVLAGSAGGAVVPTEVQETGARPPQDSQDNQDPGRDSASVPWGFFGSPPPGSQGLRGRDRSRLSPRPAASRRPPTSGSWAGPPLAPLPPRRPGSSSATPPSRRVLHAAACSARTAARPLCSPLPPTPCPPRLFQA